MKKEQKRYFLVEYVNKLTKVYNSKEELDAAISEIGRYNNRKTAPYIIGNMNTYLLDNKYYLNFHVYNKLLPKSTISEIDELTKEYDESGLIISLKDNIMSLKPENTKDNSPIYPDINIAYFEDKNKKDRSNDYAFKRIKYIPVLYNDDLKYLDASFIINCILFHASHCDLKFFEGILNEFRYSHSCGRYLDKIQETLEEVKYNGLNCMNLYYDTKDFYLAYIVEREIKRKGNGNESILRDDKGNYLYSRRRVRDFGFYVKNYECKMVKKPTMYNYSNNHEKQRELQRILNEIEITNQLKLNKM